MLNIVSKTVTVLALFCATIDALPLSAGAPEFVGRRDTGLGENSLLARIPGPLAKLSALFRRTPATLAGTSSLCNAWYEVVSGDICSNVASKHNIALDAFYSWNKAVDGSCSNLQIGYNYCVGISHANAAKITTTTTTTQAKPAQAKPAPVKPQTAAAVVASSSSWNTITGSIFSFDGSARDSFYNAGSCGLSTYFASAVPGDMPLVAMSASVMSPHGASQSNSYCGKVINIKGPNGVIKKAMIADTAGANIIDMCMELWTSFGGHDGDGTTFPVNWQFA